MGEEPSLSFACDANLERLADAVSRVERALGIADDRSPALRVVLMESLSNAIVHGSLALPGARALDDRMAIAAEARDLTGPPVWVRAGRDDGGRVVIEIEDSGPGFDWRRAGSEPGRGLSILRALCGHLAWNERGNVIRMVLKEKG